MLPGLVSQIVPESLCLSPGLKFWPTIVENLLGWTFSGLLSSSTSSGCSGGRMPLDENIHQVTFHALNDVPPCLNLGDNFADVALTALHSGRVGVAPWVKRHLWVGLQVSALKITRPGLVFLLTDLGDIQLPDLHVALEAFVPSSFHAAVVKVKMHEHFIFTPDGTQWKGDGISWGCSPSLTCINVTDLHCSWLEPWKYPLEIRWGPLAIP